MAVANVIKWYNIGTSYKAVLAFSTNIVAYVPQVGMFPFQMTYLLKTLKIPFVKRRKFTPEDLDDILNRGGSVILMYKNKKSRHIVFIDQMNETHYRSWNRKKGVSPWTEKKHFQDIIRQSKNHTDDLYVFTFAKPKTPNKV